MGLQEKIQHSDLVAYLRGSSNAVINSSIRKIQEEDPAYKALFELIEDIRQQTPLDMYRPPVIDKLSFEELEKMLEELLAGNASAQEQQLFFDYLLSSASFYKRSMLKLMQMIPAMTMEEMPEFAGEFVRLRSAEELLQDNVFRHAKPINSKEATGGLFQKLIEFIRNTFESPIPRYATLATAVIAILVVLYIGIPRAPYDQYWETPAYVQISDGSQRFRTTAPGGTEEERLYQQILWLFDWTKTDYQQGNYAAVIEKLDAPGAQSALQVMESLLAAPTPQNLDSNRIAEAKRMVQNYYFYLGAAHLGIYRQQEKALFTSSQPSHLDEAVISFSKAEALAKKYALNTSEREQYFLGFTHALQKNNNRALEELAQVKPQSEYYARAIELSNKLK